MSCRYCICFCIGDPVGVEYCYRVLVWAVGHRRGQTFTPQHNSLIIGPILPLFDKLSSSRVKLHYWRCTVAHYQSAYNQGLYKAACGTEGEVTEYLSLPAKSIVFLMFAADNLALVGVLVLNSGLPSFCLDFPHSQKSLHIGCHRDKHISWLGWGKLILNLCVEL